MPIKTVYTYVVADLLHMGHVLYLENAKSLVDSEGKLIVGVLTDEATMEKKPKPMLPFSERMRLIKALKCVDCAVAQTEYSPINNIKTIKPNILVESSSHSEEDLLKIREITNSISCKIIVMPYYPEQSSTKLKGNMINNTEKRVDELNIEEKKLWEK